MGNMWGTGSLDGIQKHLVPESPLEFYFGYISNVFFMVSPPVCIHLHSSYFALYKVFVVH